MSESEAVAILGLVGMFLMFMLVIYIIVSIPLFMFLRKSNIRNAWMAFIPIANSYKMNHYVYDLFFSKKIINQEVTREEYISKRKTFSIVLVLGVFIVSFVLGFVTGMAQGQVQPDMYSRGLYDSPSTVVVLLNMVTLLMSFAYTTLIYLGMFSMVSNKQNVGDGVSDKKPIIEPILYTILAWITMGLSWVIQFIYFSVKGENDYYLNQYLTYDSQPPEPRDTTQNNTQNNTAPTDESIRVSEEPKESDDLKSIDDIDKDR